MNAEEVVRAELAAWSSLDVDKIMAYFADDATFVAAIGYAPFSGADEIRKGVEGFLGVMTKCEIEIVHLAVAGNVVLTERIDHLVIDGNSHDAAGMGAFEVAGDKITAWRDYFDAGGTS
jgi:limonene-1,2-epoxide hydrolase